MTRSLSGGVARGRVFGRGRAHRADAGVAGTATAGLPGCSAGLAELGRELCGCEDRQVVVSADPADTAARVQPVVSVPARDGHTEPMDGFVRDRLAELVGRGGVCVLSGAGLSTESGIPLTSLTPAKEPHINTWSNHAGAVTAFLCDPEATRSSRGMAEFVPEQA